MGWANCGTDSNGRPIGYAHKATCDEPGCDAKIDRGLSFACGDMHGENEGCEKYFCSAHLNMVDVKDQDFINQLCPACTQIYKDEGALIGEDDDAS